MHLAREYLLQARDLLVKECQIISNDFARMNALLEGDRTHARAIKAQRVENERYAQYLTRTLQERPHIEPKRVKLGLEAEAARREVVVQRFTIISSQDEIEIDCEYLESSSIAPVLCQSCAQGTILAKLRAHTHTAVLNTETSRTRICLKSHVCLHSSMLPMFFNHVQLESLLSMSFLREQPTMTAGTTNCHARQRSR